MLRVSAVRRAGPFRGGSVVVSKFTVSTWSTTLILAKSPRPLDRKPILNLRPQYLNPEVCNHQIDTARIFIVLYSTLCITLTTPRDAVREI